MTIFKLSSGNHKSEKVISATVDLIGAQQLKPLLAEVSRDIIMERQALYNDVCLY